MKRKLLYCILLFACLLSSMPMMAQEISVAEVKNLFNNASEQYQAENYQEAIKGFLIAADATKYQRTEEERQTNVECQLMAAKCYFKLDKYDESYRLFKSLLINGNTTEEEKSQLYLYYFLSGYAEAMSYVPQKRFAEAGALLEEILPLADETLRQKIKREISHCYLSESTILFDIDDYFHALTYAEKARDGYHECDATEDEIVCLILIGKCKYRLYNFEGSIFAYKQAATLAESLDNDDTLMRIFISLRDLSEKIGDSGQSHEIDERMYALATVTENQDAKYRYNMFQGNKALKNKNYNLSEQWYKKNENYINNLGDNYTKATYYGDLIYLYIYAQRYDDALKYAYLSKDVGYDSSSLYNYISDDFTLEIEIANIYAQKGDSLRCFQALDSAYMLIKNIDEPKLKMYHLLHRGICYEEFNNYELAVADFKNADALLSSKYGSNDGNKILLLQHIGRAQNSLGHFQESEESEKKATEIARKIFGENSLEYIKALDYLANAEGYAGHVEAACKDFATAVELMKERTKEKLPYLNAAEREGYWEQASEIINRMTPEALMMKEYQTPFTKSCYDGLVLSKAFLLASERSTYDIIKSKGSAKDLNDYLQIASMHAKIKGWENDRKTYGDSILQLTIQTKYLESQLASRCRSYGDITSFMNIDYDKIKETLRDNEVLIDFTDYVT